MLQVRVLRSWHLNNLLHTHLPFLRVCRTYSSSSEDTDLDAARHWFTGFTKSTIPKNIATTSFSRSSGPGGQKVNKTSSKATTVWPLGALLNHIPKALHQGIKSSRYYVSSSNSLNIQSDTNRSQGENEDECHRRLHDEITSIYKRRVPGITSLETKKKVEKLKQADNSARLKMKKMHGDKKKARKSGSKDF